MAENTPVVKKDEGVYTFSKYGISIQLELFKDRYSEPTIRNNNNSNMGKHSTVRGSKAVILHN